jgi:glycosyltransferase involved in cell wall biosynthesis
MRSRCERMKVMVVSPSLNMLGGAQRVCLSVLKAMRETNCKVTIATIDQTDWPLVDIIFGEKSKPDEEFFVFSKMPDMPTIALKQAFIALSYALFLFKITLTNKANLVVNMGGEISDGLGDIVYVNAVPLRLMHLFPEIRPNQSIKWSVYSRVFSLFLKALGDTKGTVVANSKYSKGIIEKCLRKNAVVITPPLDFEENGSYMNNNIRKNLVVAVSRFRSAKGLELIPLVASLAKDCEFKLIGIADKDSRRCLKDLFEAIQRCHVGDRVQVFKNKPHGFVLEAMATAKIFLHTQSTEAFGMSIVESMAAGCVPVVPRDGGPWFDVLDQKQGEYGYSYKTAEEAARIITMLLENDQLRKDISERATKRAVAYCSSNFENKMLEIVEQVASKKAAYQKPY